MDEGPEKWDVPLTPEDREEYDVDLIRDLNEDSDPGSENDTDAVNKRPSIIFKIIGLITVIVFAATSLGIWLKVLNLPQIDFLAKSTELAKNPQIQKYQKAVVMIKSSDGQGSGFNVEPSGLIITNAHVVKDAKEIDVSFPEGSTYRGRVLASCPDVDLAVVKINGRNLPKLELELDLTPAVGDEVTIIGNPLGLADIVMKGNVTGEMIPKGWNVPAVMVEGEVRKGNSGSPVLNRNGRVVAVIFATLGSADSDEKGRVTGLAVQVKYLDRVFNTPQSLHRPAFDLRRRPVGSGNHQGFRE